MNNCELQILRLYWSSFLVQTIGDHTNDLSVAKQKIDAMKAQLAQVGIRFEPVE